MDGARISLEYVSRIDSVVCQINQDVFLESTITQLWIKVFSTNYMG